MENTKAIDSDGTSINENSDELQGKFRFSTPRRFGKQKGSGIAVELPVSATEFLLKVNSMLEDEEDRGKLFDALRNYHESRKVKKLVRDLKIVLDTAKKYPLFKEIRALIPQEHLFAYDKLTEGARTGERIVHLKRHGNEPLGFKFKGGKEHGIGIYVTSIIPGSAAHVSGLRIGDEILKVNGMILDESIHDEVVNVLKNKRSLTFVTRNMGKIPNKENNRIVWQEIDPNMRITPTDLWDPKFTNLAIGHPQSPKQTRKDDRLLAFRIGKEGLGCSIRSGIANFEGVYVSAVSTNSLADQVGLKISLRQLRTSPILGGLMSLSHGVGDQILDVNGRMFDNVKHSEAVDALKARKDLTMLVRYDEEVEAHLRRKSKPKPEVPPPILIKEGEEREVKKNAHFGDDVIVEIIEPTLMPDEEEDYLDEEEAEEGNLEPGKSNFEYDEEVTQGKDVHFVSILKTAPLMLDLEMKNDRIVVRNAVKGGAASEHGFLKRGDVLLNVEGTELTEMSSTEAEEAILEAMGRLSSHIDLVVACPQGRKPPVVQDIENYSPGKFSDGGGDLSKRRASTGFSDDDEENPSAVARAIKQFESKNPRKSEFLQRRDSLEKARNSLRLYKEKKRSTMFGGGSTGSPSTHSGASSGPSPGKVSMTTTPAKKRSEDVAKSHGLGGSLDSLTSPRMNKTSAFSMPDPKSVSIITPNRSQKLSRLGGSFDESEAGTPARENEARKKWSSAVTKIKNASSEPTNVSYVNEKGVNDGDVKIKSEQTLQISNQAVASSPNLTPMRQRDISSNGDQRPLKIIMRQNNNQGDQGLSAAPYHDNVGREAQGSNQSPMQQRPDIRHDRVDVSQSRIRQEQDIRNDRKAMSQKSRAQQEQDVSHGRDEVSQNRKRQDQDVRHGRDEVSQGRSRQHDGNRHEEQDSTQASARQQDDARLQKHIEESYKKMEAKVALHEKRRAMSSSFSAYDHRDGPSRNSLPGMINQTSGDPPMSPNRHEVRAQVHSPPVISNDDMLKSWAPTSPLRAHSVSAESLMSRKTVAFGKANATLSPESAMLSPKSRSRSMDELSPRGASPNGANNNRKKSVGFKDTVESIEPIGSVPYRSLDDVSMIGKSGWDQRMTKYATTDANNGHNQNGAKLLQPKKSALRNSPSPVPTTNIDDITPSPVITNRLSRSNDKFGFSFHSREFRNEAHGSSDHVAAAPLFQSPRSQRTSAFKSQSSSFDDDAALNEEMDQLARSLDPGFVIPEPDYDGASTSNAQTSLQNVPVPVSAPVSLPVSQSASHPVSHPAKAPPKAAKPKKRDGSLGLTNRILSNARTTLKRVGFRRSSQTSVTSQERVATADTVSAPSKSAAPRSKVSPPMAPPPPPIPPPVSSASQPQQPASFAQQAPNASRHQAKKAMAPQPPVSQPLQMPTIPSSPPVSPPPPPVSPLPQVAGRWSSSPSPLPMNTSLQQMILSSPVRQAASTRDYDERGNTQLRRGSDSSGSIVNTAIASEMSDDVKVAAVVADKGSGTRPKSMVQAMKNIDMSQVLTELKGRVNTPDKRDRPFSIHSDTPTNYASSYAHQERLPNASEQNMVSNQATAIDRSKAEVSPSRAAPDSRESRISRRQAQSVAEVDTDILPSGLGTSSVTPRSARSDGTDGALLEMEGTLKEFDDVIRSLDTEF